jgi:hypothetical protein
MHASLFVSLMIFGASIVPEPDITVVPLKDDISGQTSIQDLEWKERVKSRPLPRVPTLDDRPLTRDELRTRPPVSPTSPYAPQPRTPVMPQAPTQAGPSTTGGGYGQPGGYGQSGNLGQPGGFGQAPQPGTGGGINSGYGDFSVGSQNHIPGGNYGAQGIQRAQRAPNVSQYTSNNTVAALESQYGVAPGGQVGASAGGANKPFNGYTPPSGSSAWNNLYLPTANGTQNTYTNYVQPALNQQNFNTHISEQINGVRMLQPGYGPQPGMEVPTGASGLANPAQFINYR